LNPDNVAFRMERVYVALGEIWQSPIIGFGAESFGQRHPERNGSRAPDHLAVMSVAVLYESGIVGATAALLGFLILLATLWLAARRFAAQHNTRAVGACVAFIASLICMMVAYQVTNASQFAVNWIIIGVAAALAASRTTMSSTAIPE